MFKKTGISSLTALVLLTLAAPEVGQAIRLPAQTERIAQVTSSSQEQFPLPAQVAADTQITIDGSPTMVVVNDTLKQQFESEFSGTQVEIAANGTVPSLERLVNGELDLVALGRPLTEAERDRGIEQLTLKREKIAIIVGPDNPFEGDLTFTQFAQIFRGEITDWSEVGGEPGPITFVDRPEDSDTRLAFAPYDAFTSAPFVSGPDTVRVDNDETKDIIEALGANGISYALASHVLDLDTVKIVPMHKTLPDNPAYPYSQPRAYAYMEPADEGVKAFLGYGLAEPGQTAIALAQETEAQAIASGLSLVGAVSSSLNSGDADLESGAGLDTDGTTDIGEDGEAIAADGSVEGAAGDGADGSAGEAVSEPGEGVTGEGAASEGEGVAADGVDGDGALAQADGSVTPGAAESSDGAVDGGATGKLPMWLWWLLPLGLLALLLWWLLGRKDSEPDSGEVVPSASTADTPAAASLIGVAGQDAAANDSPASLDPVGVPAGGIVAGGLDSAAGDEVESLDSVESTGGLAQDENPVERGGVPGGVKPVAAIAATGAALMTGLSFLKAGRSGEAQSNLEEAVTQNPNDDVAWTLRGQTLAEAGEWDSALDSYDRALAIDPSSAVALTGKGVVLTKQGQPEEAIALYDQALETHERQASSKFLDAGLPLLGGTALTAAIFAAKGQALSRLGRSEEAMGALNRASNLNPSDADVWTVKGDTLAPLEETEAALASYDKAIEHRAYSPAAYLGKGYILSTLPPRSKDALTHYEWVTTLTQDTDDGQTAVEPSLLTPLLMGGTAVAGVAGTQVLRSKSLAGQGRLLVDMGQTELKQQGVQGTEASSLEASLFGDSNLEAEPPTLQNGEVTGQARIDQGMVKFDEAIALNPDDAALHIGHSLALAKVGDRERAIASMDHAETLSPENPIVQLYKGHAWMNLDQPSDAISAYESSVNLESQNPNAILAKATALDTLGHPEAAVLAFNQLLDEDMAPSTTLMTQAAALGLPLLGAKALKAHAFNGKGNALIGLGYTGAGLENLRQAVDTDPTNAQLWISQGNALNTVRQPEAAIASFERALELDPTSTEALVGKGNGLMLLNQRDEAQTYFDRASSLGDDLSGVIFPAEGEEITTTDEDFAGDIPPEEMFSAARSDASQGASAFSDDVANDQNTEGDRSTLDSLEENLPPLDSATEISPVSNDAANSETDNANPGLMTALGLSAVGTAMGLQSRSANEPGSPDSSAPEFGAPDRSGSDDAPSEGTDLNSLIGAGSSVNEENPLENPLEIPPDHPSEIPSDSPSVPIPPSTPAFSTSATSSTPATTLSMAELADVDDGLEELPDGYGESRIVLLPRDPQWAYTYWDIPNDHKQALRQQGGTQLVLRLCDVTGVDLEQGNAHSMQQFDCDELARDWYLPIPVSDRDYVMEIGYVTPDERWLMLARSQPVRVPPVYPSDWTDEQFIAVDWDETLAGQTKFTLVPPDAMNMGAAPQDNVTTFSLKQMQAMRQAGSLFGSMHQVPQHALSSFVFPSGAAFDTMMSTPLPLTNFSGIGMSGIGMSGIGFFSSMPPIRARKFWLIADAELIVYGATEPDATVTIGGQPIPLNPDGTFRFHMPFKDGVIDYPIVAVAADGEQTRSIHMTFNRNTPHQNTNTKEDAVDEWF